MLLTESLIPVSLLLQPLSAVCENLDNPNVNAIICGESWESQQPMCQEGVVILAGQLKARFARKLVRDVASEIARLSFVG